MRLLSRQKGALPYRLPSIESGWEYLCARWPIMVHSLRSLLYLTCRTRWVNLANATTPTFLLPVAKKLRSARPTNLPPQEQATAPHKGRNIYSAPKKKIVVVAVVMVCYYHGTRRIGLTPATWFCSMACCVPLSSPLPSFIRPYHGGYR